MSQIITRFAPSPTGHLHLGGARTAIFSWLLARHFGGKFFLRIEDTDLARSKQEYTDSILASMRWLGLDWDGEPVYQTDRADLYNSYVDRLLETGHAYWCDCSPEQVEAMREEARKNGLKPRYNGHCRDLGLGPAPGRCVRLKAPQEGKITFRDLVKGDIAIEASELDDMVLRRADGMPTYNMAVVVDDHEMGVTHVIRGDDHISNTPRQIMIYKALGLPVPVFGHVPMIMGKDRQKLSKRHGARAVIEYEQDGLLHEALVSYLARLGWSHGDQELFNREELLEYFDGKHLNPAPAAFDPDKLAWSNARFMRGLPLKELARRVAPFIKDGIQIEPQKLEALCEMFRERATNLAELGAAFEPLLVEAENLEYKAADKDKHFTHAGKIHLDAVAAILEQTDSFSADAIDNALNAYVTTGNHKFKEVAPPLRTALMGFMGGSHLNQIMAFLGKDKTLARLRRASSLCP